jgi:tRNA(Ile)-lysidine synthase
MTLLEKFLHYIKHENLFHPKDKLLLAVSGGVDSVVLCELCKQAGYNFVIAHCNFQLRGTESERDETYVTALATTYGVQFFVKRFATEEYAQENKISIQVAARELRYNWFRSLVGNSKLTDDSREAVQLKSLDFQPPPINWIVTAHHSDDNIETLLMNFFKGTGINGLKAILPKQQNIIRPLLFADKEALLVFAKENNLPFVEDSSNVSDKYTRNYLRNQLIPGLKKVYPQVEENLKDNLQRFREIELLYQQSIALHKKKLLEQKGNEIHIPVLKLQQTRPVATVLYEIIKAYHFTAHQATEVMALLKSESGRYIQSATHRIIKNRKWLIISPVETVEAETILIEEKDKKIIFEAGEMRIEKYSNPDIQPSTSIAQLDAAEITFPLLLRKWKPGDYFYPLGMPKKKKLSRFLIDQKLSLTQKEKVWVIETNKKIIWVVGMRIDDRFKITPHTKAIIEISHVQN